MYIIKQTTNADGSRPPIQTWNSETPPNGYAVCPDDFRAVFYSTSPAGFVNITVEDDVVTSMEVNQEALDAYLASLPEPEPEPETDDGDGDQPVTWNDLAQAYQEGVNSIDE